MCSTEKRSRETGGPLHTFFGSMNPQSVLNRLPESRIAACVCAVAGSTAVIWTLIQQWGKPACSQGSRGPIDQASAMQAHLNAGGAADCQPAEERGEMDGPAHLEELERCVARLITRKAFEKAILRDRLRQEEAVDASHHGDVELSVARLLTSKALEKAVLVDCLRVSEARAVAAERAKDEVSSSIQGAMDAAAELAQEIQRAVERAEAKADEYYRRWKRSEAKLKQLRLEMMDHQISENANMGRVLSAIQASSVCSDTSSTGHSW